MNCCASEIERIIMEREYRIKSVSIFFFSSISRLHKHIQKLKRNVIEEPLSELAHESSTISHK
jgi:hypothetical protein